MSVTQGELPSLFKSPEDRAGNRIKFGVVLTNYLLQKRKGQEQREWERIRNSIVPVGIDHPVEVGTTLVGSTDAHYFLSGRLRLVQLMASTVVLTDRTNDWSRVEVEDSTGTPKESIPDYVTFVELLSVSAKLDWEGRVVKEVVPEFVKDDEYYRREFDLQEILRHAKFEGDSVFDLLAEHGLNTLSNVIGIRVGELGKQYIENWFDALKGKTIGKKKKRLEVFTIGTSIPVFPDNMKKEVLFSLESIEPWRVRILRVLDPVVYVVSKMLYHNVVQETFVGTNMGMKPESVDNPIRGYRISKNHFNILKRDFNEEVKRIKILEAELRERFKQEFKQVLIDSLNDALGIDSSVEVQS